MAALARKRGVTLSAIVRAALSDWTYIDGQALKAGLDLTRIPADRGLNVLYSLLVDRLLAFRAPMSELNGFKARESLDEDLDRIAGDIEMGDHMVTIPAILGTAEPHSPAPDGRVLAAQSGRRRDALRAGWGAHIKSTEHVPGGLRH